MEDEKDFKLADCCLPEMEEGRYTVNGTQTVIQPEKDLFSAEKNFYVAANTEQMPENKVFKIYPESQQQGDFSGKLPFIVLNDAAYPWLRRWTEDIDGFRVPWLALIVVSEDEEAQETDMPYADLEKPAGEGVYFAWTKPEVVICKPDDSIHLLTLSKEVCQKILPAKEELCWLTHSRFVNLSATEDSLSQTDGWYSTVLANRFVPSRQGQSVKSTVHLIPVDRYFGTSVPESARWIRFISLYHWNIYSEKTEDASFVSLVEQLGANTGTVGESALVPHFLRTGEKTWSIYHGPLVPSCPQRYENLNGEERYTADGRLIYHPENGLLDVSYAAAFNLGRLITLSRRADAEKIVAWRKEYQVNRHMKQLECAMGYKKYDLAQILGKMKEEFQK